MSLIKDYLHTQMTDQLEMLTQREQLMEDIDSIVESISSVYTDDHDIEWNTIEVSHEELTRMLCDAVCKNFPSK
jgi:hypothetical protein